MLAYALFGVLILTPLVMVIINRARPGFAYQWLVAVAGALLAWALVLVLGLRLPHTLSLGTWQPEQYFLDSPQLIIDRISWPLAVALGTLLLAMILTDVVRTANVNWITWAGSLAMTAIGLVGVLAANPLTLILAWSASDLLDSGFYLGLDNTPESRRGTISIFSIRVAGSFALFGASLLTQPDPGFLDVSNSPIGTELLVILGVILRLGVLPANPPGLSDRSLRQSLGTITRLISVATALILIIRTEGLMGEPLSQSLPLLLWLGFLGLIAVYAGASWRLSADELDGRPAWILALSALSIASALRGQTDASLAWALACILSGGLSFLSSVRNRLSTWITFVGLVGISGIPFTPAWAGITLFSSPLEPILILFLIALMLLIAGYYHHLFQIPGYHISGERWINVIYPIGLVILPLTHFALGFSIHPDPGSVPLQGWIIGPVIVVLATGWIIWESRGGRFPLPVLNILDIVFSLRWLSNLMVQIFQVVGRFIYFLTGILEGDGGVLWALLWVVLMVSFLVIGSGVTP
jgi:hypothetical protein